MNIDERIALWKSLPPAPVDETDGFIEMLIAERDGLKQAVNTQTDLYRKGLVEIDRLQSQLSVAKEALNHAFVSLNFASSDPERKRVKKEVIEALQKLGETGE